jgi:hypothetical protein
MSDALISRCEVYMKLKHGKKTGLKYFTYSDIKSWRPCYDPSKYISTDFKGTAIKILNMDNIPFEDRLWCVLRSDIISEKVMRLFAVWSYRETLKFIKNPDPRSIKCANVAERYALGLATEEGLAAAYSAAYSAAESAAESAYSASDSAVESAESAAYSASRSAEYSAYSAAESASRSAAESAVESAESATWSAVYSAVESATWSAAESAYSDARLKQKDKLIEMILIEAKERVKTHKRNIEKQKKV